MKKMILIVSMFPVSAMASSASVVSALKPAWNLLPEYVRHIACVSVREFQRVSDDSDFPLSYRRKLMLTHARNGASRLDSELALATGAERIAVAPVLRGLEGLGAGLANPEVSDARAIADARASLAPFASAMACR